jgi:hypothetical protein
MTAERVYFHPLVNDLTIGVTPDAIRAFLALTRHQLKMIDL